MAYVEPASVEEVLEFRKKAPKGLLQRVARQRLIAELLESAARRAEALGRTRQAHEMREQAAEARQVADRIIRESTLR